METFSFKLLTLLLVLPLVLSGPVVIPGSCTSECRAPPTKFLYETGQTYTYDFKTSTKTYVQSTSNQQAILAVEGQALVTFRTPCDVSIQLKNTAIHGVDESSKPLASERIVSKRLENYATLVSFQDGTIDSICSHPEDDTWVVNIKRAILSMFQHSAEFLDVSENNVYENDIAGRCPTQYTVEKILQSNSVSITKTKLPNKCSQRTSGTYSFPTVAYDVKTEVNSVPLLNSTSNCGVEIKNGVIASTICQESHFFRPLSSELGGGARTDVTSSITLKKKSSDQSAPIAGAGKKSNLIYEHARINEYIIGQTFGLNKLVDKLCQQLETGSPSGVAELFVMLVDAMREGKPNTVQDAYEYITSKLQCREREKTRTLFLDALPQAGSTASIALMTKMLENKQVSERRALGWYISLPLTQFADFNTIPYLVNIFDVNSLPPAGLFGITALVRRICIKDEDQCKRSFEYLKLREKLNEALSKPRYDTKVLAALKALGNLGSLDYKEQETIFYNFIDQSRAPTPIRLAAIESTRLSHVNFRLVERLLELMVSEQNPEVAIAIYLALMRNPSSQTYESILITVRRNRFQSLPELLRFIQSHLNNIENNPSPAMEHIRNIVTKRYPFYIDDESTEMFTTRNVVAADFCATNNVGYNADLNIIYANGSIPRSAAVKLNLDLFGQSVNLFEIGARAENLEQPLMALFKKYMSGNDQSESDMKNDVQLDAFVRLFDNEIGMVAYSGKGKGKSSGNNDFKTSISQAVMDLMRGAKKAKVDVARSLLFLDTAVFFPTAAGMTLRLAVTGTTTVALGLESQLDINALMNDRRNFDLRLSVNPFAETEILASMTAHIDNVKAGIRMVSTIHSSMAADLVATRKAGSHLEIRFDLPQSKITLIDFSSKLLRIYKKEDKEITQEVTVNNGQMYERGGCSGYFSAFTGLRMCVQTSLNVPRPMVDPSTDPVPSFPLSGHGGFSIVLEKTEPSMKGYHLKISTNNNEITMEMDTPGSTTNRKITAKGSLSTSPTLKATLEASSPFGAFSAETEMINRDDVKSVSMKINRNRNDYFIQFQLNAAPKGEMIVYTSTVEMEHPAQPRAVIFESKFGLQLGRSLEISMKPSGPYARVPLQLQATLERQMTQKGHSVSLTDCNIVTPFGEVSINSAKISQGEGKASVSVDMTYGAEKHAVTFDGSREKVGRSIKSSLNYRSSRFPDTNLGLSFVSTDTSNNRSSELVMTHGPESKKSVNRLVIKLTSGHLVEDSLKVDNKLEVSYPLFGMDFNLDQTFLLNDEKVTSSFIYAKNGKRAVDIDVKIIFNPKKARTIYTVDLKLGYLDQYITFSDVCKKTGRDKYSLQPTIEFLPSKSKFETLAKVTVLENDTGMSLSVEADVRGFKNPIAFYHTSQITEEDLILTTSNKVLVNNKIHSVFDLKIFPEQLSTDATFFLIDVVDGKFFFGLAETENLPVHPKISLDLNLMRLQRHIKAIATYQEEDQTTIYANVQWDADKDLDKEFTFDFSIGNEEIEGPLKTSLMLSFEKRTYSASFISQPGQDLKCKAEFKIPSGQTMTINVDTTDVSDEDKDIDTRIQLDVVTFSGNSFKLQQYTQLTLVKRYFDFSGFHETHIQSSMFQDIKISFDSFLRASSEDCDGNIKINLTAPAYITDTKIMAKLRFASSRFLAGIVYNSDIKFLGELGGSIHRSHKLKTYQGHVKVKVPSYSDEFELSVFRSVKNLSPADSESKYSVSISDAKDRNYFKIDHSVQSSPSMQQFTFKLDNHLPFQPKTINFNGKYNSAGSKKSGRNVSPSIEVEGNFEANWVEYEVSRQNPKTLSANFKSNLNYKRATKDADFTAEIELKTPFNNMKTNELRLSGSATKGNEFKLDADASTEKEKARLAFLLNKSEGQGKVEIKLNPSNRDPIAFVLNLNKASSSYLLKSRADIGKGYVSLEGSITYTSAGNFETKMIIDSPAYGIHKYEVSGQSQTVGAKRTIELVVKKLDSPLVMATTSFQTKNTRTSMEIEGTASFEIVNPQFKLSSKFVVQNKDTKRGRQYVLKFDSVELGSLSGTVKLSQSEHMALLRACSVHEKCNEINFSFNNNPGTKTALTMLGKIASHTDAPDHVFGVRMQNTRDPKNGFVKSVEVIINDIQNKKIGFKSVTNRKGEYEFELFTHKRVSAMTYRFDYGGQDEEVETWSFWADKTRHPERKLEVILSVRPEDFGVKMALTVKHPFLPRDFNCLFEYHDGSTPFTWNLKIDFDVFDDQHKRWTLERNSKVWRNNEIITSIELRSQGTGNSITVDYNFNNDEDEFFSVSANVTFKEKNTVTKELMAHMDTSPQSFNIRIGSPVKKMALESRWNRYAEVDNFIMVITTQVFGLSPSVINVDIDNYKFDVKVYNQETPEIAYHLTGDISKDLFKTAFVRQIGTEKKEMAIMSMLIDSSDILVSRLFWKLEDLVAVRSLVQSRYQTVINQILFTFKELAKELKMKDKWAAFKNLKPTLNQLASDVAMEAKTFMKETKEDESLEDILFLLDTIYSHIRNISSHISFDDVEMHLFRAIEQFRFTLNAMMNDFTRVAGIYYSELKTYVVESGKFVAGVQRIFETLTRRTQKVYSYIDQNIQATSNWINSLISGSSGSSFFANIFETTKRDLLQLDQHIKDTIKRFKAIVDEVIFSRYDALRTAFVRTYPETTRFVHRNIETHVQSLRTSVKQSDFYDRNVAKFMMFLDSKPTKKVFAQGKKVVNPTHGWLYPIKGEVVVYDPQNGEIRHEMPGLPLKFVLGGEWGLLNSAMKGYSFGSSVRKLLIAIDNDFNFFF